MRVEQKDTGKCVLLHFDTFPTSIQSEIYYFILINNDFDLKHVKAF